MKHTFIRLYRDTAGGDGGGGLGPSLMDILGGEQEGLEPDGITLKAGYIRNPISGAVAKDPNYKDPNPGMKPPEGLNADGTLKEGYKLGEDGKPVKIDAGGAGGGQQRPEGVAEDGTLLPGYRKNATGQIEKDPDWIDPDAVKNADGTLKPGYKQLEDGSIVKDPNYKEPGKKGEPGTDDDDDDVDEATAFITAVENITGIKYEIEYPEGVDPISPEGVAHRENVIRESAMVQFEQYLAQNDPRAYAYMLHRQKGGQDADFFGDNKGFQLPTKEAMQASADSRAAIYKQELITLNQLDPAAAQVLVDAAVKDNTLTDKSDKAWDKLDTAQKEQLESLQRANDEATQRFQGELKELNTTLETAIKTGIGFVVPEAEQAAFQKYLIENMRYDKGKFYIVNNIDPKDMKVLVESAYFQFKKGDLSKLVTKQARTEAAQKLRLRMKDKNPTPGSGAGGTNINKDNLPLHQILPTAGQN